MLSLFLPLSFAWRPSIQALPQIVLPAPNLSSGLPLAQALSLRHSERSFKATPLPAQLLSDLLWSVVGINRPSIGFLTTPTAIDAQDLSVYAVLPAGIYLYHSRARGHSDGLVCSAPHRFCNDHPSTPQSNRARVRHCWTIVVGMKT
jgi:hypothetical protein